MIDIFKTIEYLYSLKPTPRSDTMQNAFYLTIKTPFVLKIFKFCPDLIGHVGKRLLRKL